MENTNLAFQTTDQATPERPEFLKIICILSFIASGLMLLVYSLGAMVLGLSQETIEELWPQMTASYPQFETVDGVEFFNQVGMMSVYSLIANVFSLVGVIMMWRLEKMGFYIYLLAELTINFFSLNINTGEEGPQYGSLIFSILIDLVFIVMYYMNLKHMKGK
jgi:heme A synthase